MNIQSEYGLLVAVSIADIKVGDTFYYQSSSGALHETVCVENDGYTIVTNRKTWISQWDKLYKKVEDTIQGIETVETNYSSVAIPAKTSKNSVVCSIAAKLAKSGVKNPMRVAWQLHKAIIAMLHAIRAKNRALCKQIKLSVLAFLVKYDLVLNDLIPTHTATMFIFPDLWLNN